MSDIEKVLQYHEATKHHLDGYARSLGYLDWDTQPDPFRRYEGAPLIALEMPSGPGPSYDGLFGGVSRGQGVMDKAGLSALFYDSLSLSAWKSAGGHRWALRVNPSSGNLHPTEAYVLCGPIEGVGSQAALYHYAPFEHGLELRAEFSSKAWNDLAKDLPPGSVLVGLSSIVWREAWKYGERAFRYCQHDAGHALGAVSVAAAMQGRLCSLVETADDRALADLIGIGGQQGPEREHPDVLVAVHLPQRMERTFLLQIPPELREMRLLGKENQLSPEHHPWPILEEVSDASQRRVPSRLGFGASGAKQLSFVHRDWASRALLRRRRSAVAMDGESWMDREDFFRILARVMPGAEWLRLPGDPEVHLVLFVHRVKGLEPGLYALVRNPAQRTFLREALEDAFLWQAPEGCPEGLPLSLLMPADVRELSRTVSCHQDIASDGVFAVAMMARFRPAIEQHGAWYYRRLFWEAGMIGQVLYLEAEAAGLRATGIGCYFDDAVHRLLGVQGQAFQSLYHFTVGGAVDDARLATLPAYEHLDSRRKR
jgi:SagB-type dehydrogenase family enzyme